MSRRLLALALPVVLILLLTTVGCSSAQRQFARAVKLESEGKVVAALRIYEKLLPRVPHYDARWLSETYRHIGECLWRLERNSEAFTAFQRAVDADSSNVTAHLRLGELYLSGGSLDHASEQASQALRYGGANNQAMELLGAAYAASGDLDLAEAAYRHVVNSDPQRVTVSVALADLYNRRGDARRARLVLGNAIAAQPSSSLPWLALGRLEEQEGNSPKAEEAYRRAVQTDDSPQTNLRLAQYLERASRIAEAEQVLRKVDAMQPTLPTALADFELLIGRATDAADRYAEALRRAPQGSSSRSGGADTVRVALVARLVEADLESDGSLGSSFGSGAQGMVTAGAVARARAHLDEYRRELDPATIAILEAEISLAESDWNMAALHGGAAVALAPDSAAAQYVLGWARYRAGNRDAARVQWQAALAADSEFVPARLALAEELLRRGDVTAAEQFVLGAVRDEPANFRALVVFARILAELRQYESATVIARRALVVEKTAAEPHLILGEIALREKRTADALVHFEQAVLLKPHSPDAISGLTRVYRYGRITRGMLRKMESVAEAEPRSATLMEIAGRLYADRGWYRDARRCLERALQIDPGRASAAHVLARTFAASGQMSAAVNSAAEMGGESAALVDGLRAQERNDLTSAARYYENALRLGEHSGVAANNLAWIYAQQGTELDRALELAKDAAELVPHNPAVLDTLGLVYLRRREYSQAINTLEAARRIATAHPQPAAEQSIRQNLAEAYIRAGQTSAAAELINNLPRSAFHR